MYKLPLDLVVHRTATGLDALIGGVAVRRLHGGESESTVVVPELIPERLGTEFCARISSKRKSGSGSGKDNHDITPEAAGSEDE